MSDYSVYPKAIDGYAQIPLAVDRYSAVNAESVNRLRSAAVNIENTLGIIPHINDGYAEEFLHVAERLDDIEVECGIYDLDRSYDGRGIRERDPRVRGSGREITADSGAVRIVNSVGDSTSALEISRTNTIFRDNAESIDPSAGKALQVSGYLEVVGMTESRMYSNIPNLSTDLNIYSGLNHMLIGDIDIEEGVTIDIYEDANLLIL
jgi:hypothetical protein